MAVEPDQLPLATPLHGPLDGVEQLGVRLRVAEHPALDIERRYAAQRQQEPYRPGRGVELAADPLADRPALVAGRPHQCHIGVVRMQQPVCVVRRHRLGRPEIHHVASADRADIRHRPPGDAVEPLRPRRQHAAQQVIAHLGGGDVDQRADQPGIDEHFHGLAARAGGMEDQRLDRPGQQFDDLRHRRRGHPEHGEPHRQFGRRLHHCGVGAHRHHGKRGIGEDNT